MSLPTPQNLQFKLREDDTLYFSVDAGQTIDLTACVPAVEVQTLDGRTILKTFTTATTPALAVADATHASLKFANDAAELGAGTFRYQVRSTAGDRDVMAEGSLEIAR